jgi:hypothetical protein
MNLNKISEKIKGFLEKLQNLPDHEKKIILWAIVIIFTIILGYFWSIRATNNLKEIGNNVNQIKFPEIQMPATVSLDIEKQNDQTAGWKTYTNDKYNFEIKYPLDWNFREYNSGAAFFPKDKPNEQGSINIGFYKRGNAYCKIPFEDYVKIAGPSEIQNYESINTIDGGKDQDGFGAYQITWNYTDSQGFGKISLPITYFEMKSEVCGSIEILLNDNNYSDIYNKIISSFNFVKQ